MSKTPVSKLVAANDVEQWLQKMKVTARKRDEKQKDIQTLIKAVMYGEAKVDAEGNLVQVLQFPTSALQELKYGQRVTVEDVSTKTKANGSTDAFGVMVAYISAITGNAMGVIETMDNGDMELASIIVGFFQ